MDLLPLIAGYLEQIGVKVEIQPMEYGAFLSAMTTQKHAAGYFMNNGHTNPTTSIRKSFTPGQIWGPSMWFSEGYTARVAEMYRTRDEATRQKMIRELTREAIDAAPYIWLPTPYVFSAWWPWVKNYDGELRVGAVKPGPVYARIWIDQDMKKRMGH